MQFFNFFKKRILKLSISVTTSQDITQKGFSKYQVSLHRCYVYFLHNLLLLLLQYQFSTFPDISNWVFKQHKGNIIISQSAASNFWYTYSWIPGNANYLLTKWCYIFFSYVLNRVDHSFWNFNFLNIYIKEIAEYFWKSKLLIGSWSIRFPNLYVSS